MVEAQSGRKTGGAGEGDWREPRVAIILVNWNGWADCVDCLDTLIGGIHPLWHVYLVDNDSADRSVEHIAAWCARPVRPAGARDFPGVLRHSAKADAPALPVRLVETPQQRTSPIAPGCRISLVRSGGNLGFAGGNNVGIRLAQVEGANWFWLLNSDTAVHANALAHLIARALARPDAGIVGSTLLYHDAPGEVQALGGAAMNPRTFVTIHIGIGSRADQVPADPAAVEVQLAYVVGASMLVSKAFVEEVGLMQEDYFLYGEEIDWATRAQGRFGQAWAPQSLVYHKVGKSSAKVMPAYSLRLMLRNKLRYVERFFPNRLGEIRRRFWWDWVRHLLKGRFAAARVTLEVLRGLADGPVVKPGAATMSEKKG